MENVSLYCDTHSSIQYTELFKQNNNTNPHVLTPSKHFKLSHLREIFTVSVIHRKNKQIENFKLHDAIWTKWQTHNYVIRPVSFPAEFFTRNECSLNRPTKDVRIKVDSFHILLDSSQIECFNSLLAWYEKWDLYSK